jgi:hypothetical protein
MFFPVMNPQVSAVIVSVTVLPDRAAVEIQHW